MPGLFMNIPLRPPIGRYLGPYSAITRRRTVSTPFGARQLARSPLTAQTCVQPDLARAGGLATNVHE
jgi:hypothetical protein